MEANTASLGSLIASSKHFARRLMATGENRLELLAVEMQEARERLLLALWLALGVATFGLLALLALNIAIVILLWSYSPVMVLLILTGIYTLTAILLYRRLACLLRGWQMLSASLEQLRKDRECLDGNHA